MLLKDYINELNKLGDGWSIVYEEVNYGHCGVGDNMVFVRGKKLGTVTCTDWESGMGSYSWGWDVYEEKAEYDAFQNKWKFYKGIEGKPVDEDVGIELPWLYYCVSADCTAYYVEKKS